MKGCAQKYRLKSILQHVLFSMLVCSTWLSYAEASVDPFLGAVLAKPNAATKTPPPTQSVTFIQALASVGPLEYLSMGTVTLKDSTGKIISKGKTNTRGSVIFYLTKNKLKNLPLKLIATGGKIIGQTGDQNNGPRFNGHLRAQISEVKQGKHNKVWMDMLSTSASVMQSKQLSYDAATSEIRAALQIGKGFPVKGLRYQNNHVGWTELQTAYKKNGGYDLYIKRLVGRIKKKERITELTPPRYITPAKKTINKMAEIINNAINPIDQTALLTSAQTEASSNTTTTTSSSFPQCTAPVGNTNGSGGISTEVIQDFGVLGMQVLLQSVGNISTAAGGIPTVIDEVGMLLIGGATGSTTASQLAAIEQQLTCISSQLNYLSEEVQDSIFATTVDSNTSCDSDTTTAFDTYEGLVYNAAPYGTSGPAGAIQSTSCFSSQTSGAASNCPLNATNSALMGALPDWNSSVTGGLSSASCGGANGINSFLFSTAASANEAGSAWQQINSLQQGKFNWYEAEQVQQLQQFLSYWSTIEYYLFTLSNEFDNWCTNSSSYDYDYGNCPTSNNLCTWECPNVGSSSTTVTTNINNAISGYIASIQQLAGNVAGSAVCSPGTIKTSNNFCAAQSNIANAYPPDLYSDEIGIWSTVNGVNGGAGLAISAYPGGLAMGVGQLGLNPYYIGQETANPGSWAASNATGPSYTQFNSQGINPSGQPSAIQQFSNPQALKTLQPTSLQVSSLQNPQLTTGTTSANGDNWADAWSFFVSSINQTYPTGGPQEPPWPTASAWTGLSATVSNTNGTGFFTSDNVAQASNYLQDDTSCNSGLNEATVDQIAFNNTIGSYTWSYSGCNPTYTPNSGSNSAPVFGVLLGRNWWPASVTNPPTGYVPPQPCVPGSTATACNVPAPKIVSFTSLTTGNTSFSLNFTPPSISSGGMAIIEYLATCTSTNSATITSFTGSTTNASATSLVLQPGSAYAGYLYSCTIEAVNSLGISSPLSNAVDINIFTAP